MSVKRTSISEIEMEMVTYGFSDPDPVPQTGNLYPYFRFDGYASDGIPAVWKMILLENEYIKLYITPDIGGKIWGAIEKSTGREFIYFNHVVKFRDVAMRGPWTSGGLEINFGSIGHTPSCATPVDYLIRENDDGSASCFVGATDLRSRTRWTVEIRLPSDKAYFITRSLWSNSTVLEQPYYHWMNVGVKTSGGLEYTYNGSHHLGHDGVAGPWPVDENGRDLSLYDSNNFGGYKSYHVFGAYSDFLGGYWHDDDFGFGHYALYDEMPGKKIWIWGMSQQGANWEDLLTDGDGQYTEIQSGRLFNQATPSSSETPFKHRGFVPGGVDTWTEYWFPVKNTKGLTGGTPSASVNVIRNADKTTIVLCANRLIDTDIEMLSGGRTVLKERITLEPLQVWEGVLDLLDSQGQLTIWLGGTEMLYDSLGAQTKLDRPVKTTASFNKESAYGLFMSGREWERQAYYTRAVAQYERCLAKDPGFQPAMIAKAGVLIRRRLFDEALTLVKDALSIDTYDPEANFIFGVVKEQTGYSVQALEAYAMASAHASFRSVSYCAMARIYLKERDLNQSLVYATKALNYNKWSEEALLINAVILRLQHKYEEAMAWLKAMDAHDPLNHFIRAERLFATKTRDHNNQLPDLIRNEFSAESFLDMAIWYYAMGLMDEALTILSFAARHPIITYWEAFLNEKLGNSLNAVKLLQIADAADPSLVFPSRTECLEPLQWAVGQSPGWKPRYYSGLLYLGIDRKEEAALHFQACHDDPDFFPFYITRAKIIRTHDSDAASRDMLRAMSLAPGSWRAGLEASRHFLEMGDKGRCLNIAREYYIKFPDNYYLGLHLAGALNLNELYAESSELLRRIKVLPNEGATDGRDLWRETHVVLAIAKMKDGNYPDALLLIESAKEWPSNLGVGKPFNTDERLEDFLGSICHDQMGRVKEVAEMQKAIIDFVAKTGYKFGKSEDLISAWLLRNMGRVKVADRIMGGLVEERADEKNIRWCRAIYKGEEGRARKIEAEEDLPVEKIPYEESTIDKTFPLLVRLHNAIRVFQQ